MSSRMARRTAGKVGCGGGPLILFFPPCGFEPAMLEESVSNHGHERVAVEALPGSPLEVVETQFFFQLLVSLLANPSRLDGGRQGAECVPFLGSAVSSITSTASLPPTSLSA